jgi:hypothetical protein
LRASCKRCNCGRGSSIAAANTRQAIAEMQAVIDHQAHEIERMRERLSKYETLDDRPREPARPAIY